MNFRKSPTNTFCDVYFCDKATMSDHTPYNLRMFAWCFCDKIGQLSVELLDPRLKDNVLGFLNSFPERKIWNVCVNKIERGAFAWCLNGLVKISCYTVVWGAFTWCLNSLVKISRYMVVWGAFTWCLNSLVKISCYMVVCTLPAFSLFHLIASKRLVFDTTVT